MEISPEQLNSFRALYLEKFGVELSQQETLAKALSLLQLMKIVYQPLNEADLRRVNDRNKLLLNKSL